MKRNLTLVIRALLMAATVAGAIATTTSAETWTIPGGGTATASGVFCETIRWAPQANDRYWNIYVQSVGGTKARPFATNTVRMTTQIDYTMDDINDATKWRFWWQYTRTAAVNPSTGVYSFAFGRERFSTTITAQAVAFRTWHKLDFVDGGGRVVSAGPWVLVGATDRSFQGRNTWVSWNGKLHWGACALTSEPWR